MRRPISFLPIKNITQVPASTEAVLASTEEAETHRSSQKLDDDEPAHVMSLSDARFNTDSFKGGKMRLVATRWDEKLYSSILAELIGWWRRRLWLKAGMCTCALRLQARMMKDAFLE